MRNGAKTVNALVTFPNSLNGPPHGNSRRFWMVVDFLRGEGFDVNIAAPGKPPRAPRVEFNRFHSIEELKLAKRWKALSKFVPIDGLAYSKSLGKKLSRLVEVNNYGLVVMNYVFFARALDKLSDNVVKVIDCHDRFSGRGKRMQGASSFFSCTAGWEVEQLNRADLALAITEDDRAFFESLAPDVNVVHFPFKDTSPKFQSRAGVSQTLSLGIIGSGNQLNVRDTKAFLEELDRFHGQFWIVVGGGLSDALKNDPELERLQTEFVFFGTYENLTDFDGLVDIFLVVNSLGSGMSIKFAELISAQAPVVSTQVGRRGTDSDFYFHNFSSHSEIVQFVRQSNKSRASLIPELLVASREIEAHALKRIQEASSNLAGLLDSALAR